MNPSKTLTVFGCSLLLAAFGCEVQKSLGDLPAEEDSLLGGGGESGAGVDPSGGTNASGAPGGDSGGTGSAGTGSWNGAGTGGSSAGGSAGKGGGCNSPYGSPPVVSDEAPGCPCDGSEPDACVYRTRDPYWEMAFSCVDGEWLMVEDGACYPQGDGGARCVVNNHIYWSGSSRTFRDPFSCNSCNCEDGNLICTEIGCSEPCPFGTEPGRSCLECGPDDECRTVETGCFPACEDDADCDGGVCRDGACVNVCG